MKDLNTQEGNDSSGNAEPLYGNATLAMLQEQLQTALNFTQSSGSIHSLTQLGITASASDDGTLTLNMSTLDSMLNSNYPDVISFFQPTVAFTSFGGNLSKVLDNLSNSAPFGAIYLALQQNSTEESQLNKSISNEDAVISTEQSQLTTELNEANYTLQAIPSQLQEIDEMYSAITGYNQRTNG
jgi:flagellar hook-associated protein 2